MKILLRPLVIIFKSVNDIREKNYQSRLRMEEKARDNGIIIEPLEEEIEELQNKVTLLSQRVDELVEENERLETENKALKEKS